MQLYLSNKDTEFILFRPIRNNMISAFVKLEQILTTNGYSNDDLVITSCPTADQISVLLSNASIAADNLQQQQQQQLQQQAASRKVSTTSVDGDRPQRKISLEKKVSFDASGSEAAAATTSASSVHDTKIDEKEEEIV